MHALILRENGECSLPDRSAWHYSKITYIFSLGKDWASREPRNTSPVLREQNHLRLRRALPPTILATKTCGSCGAPEKWKARSNGRKARRFVYWWPVVVMFLVDPRSPVSSRIGPKGSRRFLCVSASQRFMSSHRRTNGQNFLPQRTQRAQRIGIGYHNSECSTRKADRFVYWRKRILGHGQRDGET